MDSKTVRWLAAFVTLVMGMSPLEAQPDAPAKSPSQQYAGAVADWRTRRPVIGKTFFEQKSASREKVADTPDSFVRTVENDFASGAKLDQMILRDNSIGLVYPGALLWTQPLFDGQLDLLRTFPRQVEVTLVGGIPKPGQEIRSSFSFDGTFADFTRRSQALVATCLTTGPRIKVTRKEMHDLKTSLLEAGLSLDTWFADVSGTLHDAKRDGRSYAMLSIDQVYYSIAAEQPGLEGYIRSDLWNDAALADYVLKNIGAKGEIAWVRNVSYGRRVLITVASSSSEAELMRALRLSGGFGGVSYDGSIDESVRKTWSSMEVQAYVLGGKAPKELTDLIAGKPQEFLENVNKFLKATIEFDQRTYAFPMSFEVRYVDDDAAVASYETAAYSGTIATSSPKYVSLSDVDVHMDAQHAVLKEGDWDVGSDDATRVDVGYSLQPSQGGRALTLAVTMDVYELEKNGVFKPGKTHITTSQEIVVYRVPDDAAYRITGIQEKPRGSESKVFKGELRGPIDFGPVGLLRDVSVTVDQKGNDRAIQDLRAKLDCTATFDRGSAR